MCRCWRGRNRDSGDLLHVDADGVGPGVAAVSRADDGGSEGLAAGAVLAAMRERALPALVGDQAHAVDEYATSSPRGWDHDLVADRLVFLARIEDDPTRAPGNALVDRTREECGAAEGDGVVERAPVGVLCRRNEPIPDGIGLLRRNRVTCDRLLVVQHYVGGVDPGGDGRLPVVPTIGGSADDDRAGAAERWPVGVEGVADRVGDLAVSGEAHPGVSGPVEEPRGT